MEAFGQTVAVGVEIRLLIEGGNGLPVHVAAAPFEHGQGVGEDDVLLELSPALPDAPVAAVTPAKDCGKDRVSHRFNAGGKIKNERRREFRGLEHVLYRTDI